MDFVKGLTTYAEQQLPFGQPLQIVFLLAFPQLPSVVGVGSRPLEKGSSC